MARVRTPAASLAALLAVGAAVIWIGWGGRERAVVSAAPPGQSGGRQATVTLARRDFVRSVRLSGTVEAIQSTTISAPRLSGPSANSLVITRLVRAGSTVKPGDLIVEFDRQQQVTTALDRRAELRDLEQQIRKREAQERAAAARDENEIAQAESARSRAELEMVKNDMIPRINAEKNKNALEQARATVAQLQATFALKRKAAEADLRILAIRRDRAGNAMRMAEANAERMAIQAPIGGMAVLKTIWKSNNMAEVQEGEEVRTGVPVVDIVNPSAMRVRARVNQADINALRVGQPVHVGLDAYPDLAFQGRVAQISPLGVTSTLSPKVRHFIVLIDVEGSHPNLMPDLTASLDVELARAPGVLVVPRDALRVDGGRTLVRLQRGSGFEDRAVSLGPMSAHEAVVASGLDEGAVVARNAAGAPR
jgi:multidrug efflux pump subunit AcrA (membrane-fusion protein)